LCNGVIETMGRVNYEGKIKHPFTAHPKIDPQTGESSLCVHPLLGLCCMAVQQMRAALVNIQSGIACAYFAFVVSVMWYVHSNVGKPLLFNFAWYKLTLVLISDLQFLCTVFVIDSKVRLLRTVILILK